VIEFHRLCAVQASLVTLLALAGCSRPVAPSLVPVAPARNAENRPLPRAGEVDEAFVALQELVRIKLGTAATINEAQTTQRVLASVDREGNRCWLFRGEELWNPDEKVLEVDPFDEGKVLRNLGDSHRLWGGSTKKFSNYMAIVWFEPSKRTWILGLLEVASIFVHDDLPLEYTRAQWGDEFAQRYEPSLPRIELRPSP